jgi:hypothetical protein
MESPSAFRRILSMPDPIELGATDARRSRSIIGTNADGKETKGGLGSPPAAKSVTLAAAETLIATPTYAGQQPLKLTKAPNCDGSVGVNG